MDRKQKKFELLKNSVNTLLVATLGTAGFVFVNFYTLDNTRIILGSSATVMLAIFTLLLARNALED